MNIPENGFYYHYKHDPSVDDINYSYEVVGVSRDSETNEYDVVYRPLYESTFLGPAQFVVRPLAMFTENVVVNGVEMPRFQKITDPVRTSTLALHRAQRYGYSS